VTRKLNKLKTCSVFISLSRESNVCLSVRKNLHCLRSCPIPSLSFKFSTFTLLLFCLFETTKQR